MSATLSIVIGILCIAAFACLNLILQPKWFPAARSSSRGAHVLLGIGELVLFLAGVALVAAGSAMIGTSIGYGD